MDLKASWTPLPFLLPPTSLASFAVTVGVPHHPEKAKTLNRQEGLSRWLLLSLLAGDYVIVVFLLQRASPSNEIATMHRTKRRPPLPFSDFSSNSQDSLPTTSAKPLKVGDIVVWVSLCVQMYDLHTHTLTHTHTHLFLFVGYSTSPLSLVLCASKWAQPLSHFSWHWWAQCDWRLFKGIVN